MTTAQLIVSIDDARRLRRCAETLILGRITARSPADGAWLDQWLDRLMAPVGPPPAECIAVVEAPPAVVLTFVEHPRYADAHPDEPATHEIREGRCNRCVVVERSDTGEHVLLWGMADQWSVSRADPAWAKHRAELPTPIEVVGL